MPRDTHPMTMFSAAILAMQRESLFVKRYNEGMKKTEYWDPMYEDACNLMARLPEIGAYIYRMKYKGDVPIAPDPKLDLGGNFAHMMDARIVFTLMEIQHTYYTVNTQQHFKNGQQLSSTSQHNCAKYIRIQHW